LPAPPAALRPLRADVSGRGEVGSLPARAEAGRDEVRDGGLQGSDFRV